MLGPVDAPPRFLFIHHHGVIINEVLALVVVVARGFFRCPDRDLAAGPSSWVREILVKKQVDERSEDKTNGRATHARALGCSQRGSHGESVATRFAPNPSPGRRHLAVGSPAPTS